MTLSQHTYGYRQFSRALGKVWLAFLVVAALLTFFVDVVLMSIAALVDFAGYPNRLGHYLRTKADLDWSFLAITPLFFMVYLFHQVLSALFATLSFIVIGRVAVWWMVATAPLAVRKSGFSFFSDFYWEVGPLMPRMVWPRFLMLLAIQIPVVIVCWLCVREVRRPPLRISAANTRGEGPP